MSAPPPSGPTSTSVTEVSKGTATAMSGIALIPLFLFHLGAAVLSYKKYGSFGWALVCFIFAYFYYPYHAFFLAGAPAPVMMGGMKALSKLKLFS